MINHHIFQIFQRKHYIRPAPKANLGAKLETIPATRPRAEAEAAYVFLSFNPSVLFETIEVLMGKKLAGSTIS